MSKKDFEKLLHKAIDLLIKHLYDLAIAPSHKGLGSCEVAQATDN
jgi:hypothetical protein